MNKPATYFETPEAFREWMKNHFEDQDELWVGYYKKATGIPSITWPESVAVALCFGWIDGLRNSIDEKRYRIRFTPRRKNSHWSAVNIEMMHGLLEQDLVHPKGKAAFEARSETRSKVYSYERKNAQFTTEFQVRFKENKAAWAYFTDTAPYYKKAATYWVMSAKRQDTRIRRLETLIACSAKGEKIPQMRRN